MKIVRRQRWAASLLLSLFFSVACGQGQTAPRFSGFINARYSYDNKDSSTQGFDIRRVRLAADGMLSDKVDYKFQTEYETEVKIIDAFLRWKIAPEFNIQVGEYKVQYSQETLYGPTSWLTIENPAAVARLNGYNDLSGIKANGRDIGISIYGSLFNKVFSYKLGVFNGNGINTKDDNDKKDIAGLVWLRPISNLAFSFGLYNGHYGAKGNEHIRNRTSVGAEWKDRKLTIRSEYLHGNTAGQQSDGIYGHVAYFVSPKIQPLISVDYFKADKELDEHQTSYQVGVNILPVNRLRIQVAYTYTDYKASKDVHQIETQFILQF